MTWTLMNYNIHSGEDEQGRMNLEGIMDVIRSVQPDFVFTEEVACHVSTAGDVDEAALLQDGLGMHVTFAKSIDWMGGDYGIALLSRQPVTDVQVYPIPDLEEEKRDRWFEHRIVLRCQTLYEGQPVTLLVTHLGLSEGERQLGVQLLCSLLDDITTPVILGGDLNTQPDEPLMAPLLERLQMHSTAYTFPSSDPNVKIDYLLTSPHWHVEAEYPLPDQASDHLALVKKVHLMNHA